MNENPDDLSAPKKWGIAIRPFAYTASVSAIWVGMALSYYMEHPVRWGLFALTLAGVVCFHTAANLLNDYYDYRRKLDTEPLPMSGALVRGLLSEKQIFRGAMVCLLTGSLCGLALTALTDWRLLLIGAAGFIPVLGYTTARFCFKYSGLGDLAIFWAFGPLTVFGTWWVQTRTFSWLPIFWSLPPVLLSVGILHANNWRDIQSDLSRGCRTIAGTIGETASKRYYHALLIGPYILVSGYVAIQQLLGINLAAPLWTLAVFLMLPATLKLLRKDRGDPSFLALDGRTAQLQLQVGGLLTLAFIAARLLPG